MSHGPVLEVELVHRGLWFRGLGGLGVQGFRVEGSGFTEAVGAVWWSRVWGV